MAFNASPFLHVLIFIERHPADYTAKATTLPNLTLNRKRYVSTVTNLFF
jgi:hypothetical protein